MDQHRQLLHQGNLTREMGLPLTRDIQKRQSAYTVKASITHMITVPSSRNTSLGGDMGLKMTWMVRLLGASTRLVVRYEARLLHMVDLV